MNETHTPGPWKPLKGIEDDDNRWIVVQAEHDREYLIATVENGAPGDCLETEGANARLIAAAPELLEAAKHAAMEWRLHGQLTDSCRVLERAIASASAAPEVPHA